MKFKWQHHDKQEDIDTLGLRTATWNQSARSRHRAKLMGVSLNKGVDDDGWYCVVEHGSYRETCYDWWEVYHALETIWELQDLKQNW